MLDQDSTLVIEVLSRVVDFEGDALTVSNINVDAAQGTAVLNADQSITFTPTANFHGTVSLSYDVSDGDAQGRVLSVVESIVVNSVNDAPVAGSTSISLANGSEDTPYTLKASDLLQGFSDVDGDSLAIGSISTTHGSVVSNQNGTFTVTPETNYNGQVTVS